MTKRYDFKNDKATMEWLESQKGQTRATYKTAWRYFLAHAGMTGDQILEDRKTDNEYAWEKKVLGFKTWLTDQMGQSQNSAKTGAGSARSFFSYHRMPLEFRKVEKAQLNKAMRKTEDYRFSREDLKKMVEVADLTEKYVVLVGKTFGLRAGDFLRLKRGDLEPYIDREPPIPIGEYQTEKEEVKAHPDST